MSWSRSNAIKSKDECGAKKTMKKRLLLPMQSGITALNVHGDRTAPARSNDHLRLVLVELLLGDPDGFVEVMVRQFWIENRVAVLRQEGRFDAAWDRLPA